MLLELRLKRPQSCHEIGVPAQRVSCSHPEVFVQSRQVDAEHATIGDDLTSSDPEAVNVFRTGAGEAYYSRAAAILADLESAREAVADAVTQLAGPVRLIA